MPSWNETHASTLQRLGITIPEILLPKSGTDLSKWSSHRRRRCLLHAGDRPRAPVPMGPGERAALPKKSFSLGHAEEKRNYFEARRIVR